MSDNEVVTLEAILRDVYNEFADRDIENLQSLMAIQEKIVQEHNDNPDLNNGWEIAYEKCNLLSLMIDEKKAQEATQEYIRTQMWFLEIH